VSIGKTAGIVVDWKAAKPNAEDQESKPIFASAHDLRRSFGERWSSRIMPKELMRHKSIDTTMRFYVAQNADKTVSILWAAYNEQNEASMQVLVSSPEPVDYGISCSKSNCFPRLPKRRYRRLGVLAQLHRMPHRLPFVSHNQLHWTICQTTWGISIACEPNQNDMTQPFSPSLHRHQAHQNNSRKVRGRCIETSQKVSYAMWRIASTQSLSPKQA